MAAHDEVSSPRWSDGPPLLPDNGRSAPLAHAIVPGAVGVPKPAKCAPHETVHPGSSLPAVQPSVIVTARRQAKSTARSEAVDVAWNLGKWLLASVKLAGNAQRTAVALIYGYLLKQREKKWRLRNPVALNDLGEWKWSLACRRIALDEKTVVVSIGMADHDISGVEAIVYKNVLAIRIRLGSGKMLNRAEPLPTAVSEAIVRTSWDSDEVVIKLVQVET